MTFDLRGQTEILNVHSLEIILDIKTISFMQSPLVKYVIFCLDDFWPPRSNLTSEVKLKIWNVHNSEAVIHIQKIFFCILFDKYAHKNFDLI